MWKIERIVKKGNYLYAVVPGHPNANKHGYVLHHRVIVENSLGRLLDPEEVVHHKNGDRRDNREENLEVKTNEQHAREHGLARGRKWVELRCPHCNKKFSKPLNASHVQKGGEFSSCSAKCRGKFSRRMQLEGRTHEVERAISGNIVRVFRKGGTRQSRGNRRQRDP